MKRFKQMLNESNISKMMGIKDYHQNKANNLEQELKNMHTSHPDYEKKHKNWHYHENLADEISNAIYIHDNIDKWAPKR